MIYHIQINQSVAIIDLATGERQVRSPGRLGGVSGGMQIVTGGPDGPRLAFGLSDVMWRLRLRAPALTNPRARFYFTERGWQRVGRVVAAEARRRGHLVQVIRRKNPPRSQVVYRDADQVALLPGRRPGSTGQP